MCNKILRNGDIFDVKIANFRGLIAKIGYLRPILASRPPLVAHFRGIFHWNYALRYVGGVLEIKKLDFRGLKGTFDVKTPYFRGLIA